MSTIDNSFKDAMSEIPTSVSVVSSIEHKNIFGCTISSLVSLDVNVESAKILFVLKKESLVGNKIISNKNFSVNVLAQSQQHFAKYFSQERKPDVIDDNKWHIEDMIYAVLQNAKVVFNCELSSVIESYSANVFVGKVLSIKNSLGTSPLIYSSRKFTGIRD